MILARCPACQTVFRVQPEQLRAQQGTVRCGHCYLPFNALDHLIEASAAPTRGRPGADPGSAASDAAPRAASQLDHLTEPAPRRPGEPSGGAPVTPPAAPEARRPEAPRPEAPRTEAPRPESPLPQPEAPLREAVAADTLPETGPPEPRPAQAGPPGAGAESFFVLDEKWPMDERADDTGGFPRFEPTDSAYARPAPAPPGEAPRFAPGTSPSPTAKGSTFDDLASRLEFGLPDSFLTASPPADAPRGSAPADTRPPRQDYPPTSGTSDTAAPDFVDLPDLPFPEPTLQPFPGPAYEPEADTEIGPTIAPATPEGGPGERGAGDASAGFVPQAPFIPDETPPIEHLDAAYGPPPASSGRRWLWGLAIGILLGALAAQAAYVFREEITRQWPALRPLYLAVCEQLACTVPLPRIAAAISIETSDLLSDPAEPGRFVLNAVVRNRATHVQALPHLELTLTDAQDRPLVRRVFAPQEWVPRGELTRGFLAGEELGAHLPFTAPSVEAAGYRVYVFYP